MLTPAADNRRLCKKAPYKPDPTKTLRFRIGDGDCIKCFKKENEAYEVMCSYKYDRSSPWYNYCKDYGILTSCGEKCYVEQLRKTKPTKPNSEEVLHKDL